MSQQPEPSPPPGVRQIVEALVNRALSRCEQDGLDLGEFHRVMLMESAACTPATLTELFERTFARFKSAQN